MVHYMVNQRGEIDERSLLCRHTLFHFRRARCGRGPNEKSRTLSFLLDVLPKRSQLLFRRRLETKRLFNERKLQNKRGTHAIRYILGIPCKSLAVARCIDFFRGQRHVPVSVLCWHWTEQVLRKGNTCHHSNRWVKRWLMECVGLQYCLCSFRKRTNKDHTLTPCGFCKKS